MTRFLWWVGLCLLGEFAVIVSILGFAQPAPALFQIMGMFTVIVGYALFLRGER